ncbi:hypothetical protein A4O28_24370 [Salmonella enterica subsp. enterica serovar Typhimurium]|nr:hypothetical protein [Salmonella enterica subsp. enterica serovar Typhimurium]EDA3749098.1 hypothetical protein [Salmonella enterica subsp. enterica serovar Typhimurium]EDH9516267.1 hypothetical protein [Salmonella enterica subsp. enterica serovar Typhimurium]
MEGIHRARLLLLSEEGKSRFRDAFGFTGIIREMNTDKVLSPGIPEQSRKEGSYTIVVWW